MSPRKTKRTVRIRTLSSPTLKPNSTPISELRGQSFFIHDNRARPFHVVFGDDDIVRVFRRPFEEHSGVFEPIEGSEYNVPLIRFNGVTRAFIGEDVKEADVSRGNTILLEFVHNKYAYIGHAIFSFTSPDRIKTYYSSIGNNDVPYPIAITPLHVFVLIERRMVKRSVFPPSFRDWPEASDFFYGHTDPTRRRVKRGGNTFVRPLPSTRLPRARLLVPRFGVPK